MNKVTKPSKNDGIWAIVLELANLVRAICG
jgi:hypothetical protein